jgi:hypothetical protein
MGVALRIVNGHMLRLSYSFYIPNGAAGWGSHSCSSLFQF